MKMTLVRTCGTEETRTEVDARVVGKWIKVGRRTFCAASLRETRKSAEGNMIRVSHRLEKGGQP
jgi:hypothetical protein